MSHALGRTMLAYHRVYRHIDGENQIVGRLATKIAGLLMGKHKPIYDPASDCGDHVIVTNARYLLLTGRKMTDKVYYKHSGSPGHLKVTPVFRMIEKKGTGEILRKAVSGMLPKNKLRRPRLARLKIFDLEDAGPVIRNVLRRYDDMVIPQRTKGKAAGGAVEEAKKEPLPPQLGGPPIPSSKAKRVSDTPALGSLGGFQPQALYRPRVKPRKVKKRKATPGVMKIYDAQGREWGRQKWKEDKAKPQGEVQTN